MSLWMKGRRRDGTAVGGGLRSDESVAEFTERAFKSGWKSLEVRDSLTKEQVAGISCHPDTGKCTWWAEAEA